MRRADNLQRDGEINQTAVANVIADYLTFFDHVAIDDPRASKRLQDRVHRALSGKALTPDTLVWFVQAFGFSDGDARQLWSHFTGIDPDQVTDMPSDFAPPRPDAAALRTAMTETISLHETHYIGTDGLPREHKASQRIRALADGVARHPIGFDYEVDAIEVEDGYASEIYWQGGLPAADIVLPRPLRQGETRRVDFRLCISPSQERPPLEFRRWAARRTTDVCIEVRFHLDRRPAAVWWTTWHDPVPGSPPTTQERTALEKRSDCYSVSKSLAFVQRSVVGFSWEW